AGLVPTMSLPEVPPPDGLLQFNWIDSGTVRPSRQEALVAALRHVPRPPAALHKLLSPHFLEHASSGELSDLINGEAQIAAKVLATVNSPAYGLQQPVSSIGHAVTFLGLNTVRGICLHYLLDDAFKASDPSLQKTHAQLWRASALSSELCGRLAPRLGLAEPGALVAQVLLSFLGHVTTATLMRQQAASPPPEGLLDRIHWSQERLGLGASEIGGLLLREWGLPPSIVDEVVAIDRMAVTPAGTLPAARAQRLAVAYFCARLGERLATAGADLPIDLASPDPMADASPDGYHLRSHLASPELARLGEHLRSAAVVNPVQTMVRLGRDPR
ncbi:MAG: hypothetical protein CFE45_29255, partial [Burkholderiales bacterium PBB5]